MKFRRKHIPPIDTLYYQLYRDSDTVQPKNETIDVLHNVLLRVTNIL